MLDLKPSARLLACAGFYLLALKHGGGPVLHHADPHASWKLVDLLNDVLHIVPHTASAGGTLILCLHTPHYIVICVTPYTMQSVCLGMENVADIVHICIRYCKRDGQLQYVKRRHSPSGANLFQLYRSLYQYRRLNRINSTSFHSSMSCEQQKTISSFSTVTTGAL